MNKESKTPLDLSQFEGHTPGPWNRTTGQEDIAVLGPDGGKVCIATHYRGRFGGEGRRQSREVYANADLMSCAPDLLAEVKRLREEKAELVAALETMLDVQSSRRHPLGAPDEGIAYAAARATNKARAALANARAT